MPVVNEQDQHKSRRQRFSKFGRPRRSVSRSCDSPLARSVRYAVCLCVSGPRALSPRDPPAGRAGRPSSRHHGMRGRTPLGLAHDVPRSSAGHQSLDRRVELRGSRLGINEGGGRFCLRASSCITPARGSPEPLPVAGVIAACESGRNH
jgi:hypothetical protein